MAAYRRVTGRILSRDCYREEQWDPDKEKYEQKSTETMRVEYTVKGKIYTHSFAGDDIHGEVGGDYELMYLVHDPETVRPALNVRKKRRIWIPVLLVIAGILVVTGIVAWIYFSHTSSILHVPKGFISMQEYLNMYGFQDSTDLCVYRYDSAEIVENEAGYQIMTEEDAGKVEAYFANFEEVIESEKYLDQCLAAEDSISAGDYCMIDTREGQTSGDWTYGAYDNYSVWFFDVETMTLYYIHYNV